MDQTIREHHNWHRRPRFSLVVAIACILIKIDHHWTVIMGLRKLQTNHFRIDLVRKFTRSSTKLVPN